MLATYPFYTICLVSCVYNVLAYKIYDANTLLKHPPNNELQKGEMAEIIDIDPPVEYTTMDFAFEGAQHIAYYVDPAERCYDDHIKCLTTVLSPSRPVCGTNRYEKLETKFGSLCDIYFENCKKKDAYWTVIDYGNCKRAHQLMQFEMVKEVIQTTEDPKRTTTRNMPWLHDPADSRPTI